MQSVKKYLEIIAFACVAIFMCFMFLELISNEAQQGKWIEESFELRINDEEYGKFNISTSSLPPVKKGDEIVFSKKLSKADFEDKNLVFRTYGSAVEVYVSDKYLYSYGERLYQEGEMLGRGYHIVRIRGIEGYNPYLEIKLLPAENMSYAWIDFLKFSDSNTIWRDLIKENLFSLMISFFMFLIGMIGYITSLIAYARQKTENYYQMYAFASAFFIGLWNICTFSFLQFMTDNYESASLLEYLSVYIAGFTYLATIEIIKKNSKYAKILKWMKYTYLVFICSSFILHILDVVWISQTITLYRACIGSMLIAIAVIFLINYKEQDRYEKILSICNAVAIALATMQMVLLNLDVTMISVGGRNLQASNAFTTVAICIVVAAPILSYTLKVMEIDNYEKQISIYKNIAYKDQMTGLDNRYGGIAFALEIRKSNTPYSIIMFDLNNLKTVNDTHGHDAGDTLIKDFASCLQRTFIGENYINVRHGGDEFITIAKVADIEFLQDKVKELQKRINDENAEGYNDWNISFAYGVAGSFETQNGKYEDVLSIADERMYENKTKLGGGGAKK